jgi:hypothetical protein
MQGGGGPAASAAAMRPAKSYVRRWMDGKKRRWAGYWELFKHSPWHHQVFMAIVIIQCLYLVVERAVLLANADLSNSDTMRQQVYFLGVILLSVWFVGYFAIHSVLEVNVSAQGGSRS